MKSFRENLRDELNFQGMTVKELSAKTGIIKGTLDNYLGVRESIPPADIAVKIADALNVSVEFLVTGKEHISRRISKNQIHLKHTMQELGRIPEPIQNSIKDLIHVASENYAKVLKTNS